VSPDPQSAASSYSNYYSVPYRLVGTKVLARLGESELTVFAEGASVASHARARGKGQNVTDLAHYPETKRISSQEIHRRRLLAVRTSGPYSALFVHELKQGPWVFGDQLARLAQLLGAYGPEALEQACQRALFFGATDGAKRIERILVAGLQQLPLPHVPRPSALAVARDFARPLQEYDALLRGEEVRA